MEDTDFVTFDSIQERFGPAVRRIVEGETKVSKVGRCRLNPWNPRSSSLALRAEN